MSAFKVKFSVKGYVLSRKNQHIRLLHQLILATRRKSIRWKITRYAPDQFRANDAKKNKVVSIKMPWLYGQDWIGLGNQIAIIKIASSIMSYVQGTKEMQLIWDLLSIGIDPTGGYEIFNQPLIDSKFNQGDHMDWKSKYYQVLEQLSQLHQATKTNKIKWKRDRSIENESYSAFANNIFCNIELLSPLISDDSVAKNAMVRVSIGSSTSNFFSGTEGMYFVEEILALASTSWARKLRKENLELKELNRKLQSLKNF